MFFKGISTFPTSPRISSRLGFFKEGQEPKENCEGTWAHNLSAFLFQSWTILSFRTKLTISFYTDLSLLKNCLASFLRNNYFCIHFSLVYRIFIKNSLWQPQVIIDFVAECLILGNHPRGSRWGSLCSRECSACHGHYSHCFTEGTLNPESWLRGAGLREGRLTFWWCSLYPQGPSFLTLWPPVLRACLGGCFLLSSDDHGDHLFDYRRFLPDSTKPDTIMQWALTWLLSHSATPNSRCCCFSWGQGLPVRYCSSDVPRLSGYHTCALCKVYA